MTNRNTVVFVTGYSDDLIELDGAIRDELYANLDEPTVLSFPKIGVALAVTYDEDGIWRIEQRSGDQQVTIIRCEDREGYSGPDGDVYSDVAQVRDTTEWSRQ